LIIAKEGLSTAFADYQEDIAEFNNIQVTVLPGGHHLHMEEQALKIAEIFTPLFTEGK
jgi:hypothetical protein